MAQSQATPPTPSPAPAEVWIGIDVAKQTVEAALHGTDPIGSTASFARTQLRAVLEATGRYSIEVLDWLLQADAAIAPACVNPLHAKRFAQSLGARNKTDSADARMLARLGAERRPRPYEPPSATITELRALVRERRELVVNQTALGNRMGEGSDSSFVKRQRARLKKSLATMIAALEAEIKRVAQADKKVWADVNRLMTIPGVGLVTAISVYAELGDLRRFASGRQLAAFAGVSPRRFESGSSVHGRTRLCKQGNPTVRAVLFMSAVTTARLERGMKATYTRLVEQNNKPKMAALGALMRRQLVLMRAVLVREEDYREPVENCPRKEQKAVA